MKARRALFAAAILAASCAPALAQDIQVYRCGNAYSDSPCGAGQRVVLIQPSTIETTPGRWMTTDYAAAYLYTGCCYPGGPWNGYYGARRWHGGGGGYAYGARGWRRP